MPPLYWLIRERENELEIVAGPILNEDDLDNAMIAVLVSDGINLTHTYFAVCRDSVGEFETVNFSPDEVEWFTQMALDMGADPGELGDILNADWSEVGDEQAEAGNGRHPPTQPGLPIP